MEPENNVSDVWSLVCQIVLWLMTLTEFQGHFICDCWETCRMSNCLCLWSAWLRRWPSMSFVDSGQVSHGWNFTLWHPTATTFLWLTATQQTPGHPERRGRQTTE